MFFREGTLSFRIKTDRKQQLYLMELKKNMMRDDEEYHESRVEKSGKHFLG